MGRTRQHPIPEGFAISVLTPRESSPHQIIESATVRRGTTSVITTDEYLARRRPREVPGRRTVLGVTIIRQGGNGLPQARVPD